MDLNFFENSELGQLRFIEGRDQTTALEIMDRGRVRRYPVPHNLWPGDVVPFVRSCVGACHIERPEDLLTGVQNWVDQRYPADVQRHLTIWIGEEEYLHEAEILHFSWDGLEVTANERVAEIQTKSLDCRYITDQSLLKWTILCWFAEVESAALFSRQIQERSLTRVSQGFWNLGILAFNAERWVSIGIPNSKIIAEATKRGVKLREMNREEKDFALFLNICRTRRILPLDD